MVSNLNGTERRECMGREVTCAIGSVIAFAFYVVERILGYSLLAEYDETGMASLQIKSQG